MPILARETELFPEGLLERPEVGTEEQVQWWVLYTLPRHEKELMRRLLGQSLSFYGPLLARRSRSPAGRMRTAHVPLFPSYVFLYGDTTERARALTSNCVSRWLAAPDGAALTRDLRQIHRLIQSGAPLTPEARLEPGARVRIRSGPLLGMEGVIVKRPGPLKLIVAVNFLQQGASLLIEDYQVEPID